MEKNLVGISAFTNYFLTTIAQILLILKIGNPRIWQLLNTFLPPEPKENAFWSILEHGFFTSRDFLWYLEVF